MAGALTLCSGCVEPLDSTRSVKPERSVGEVIYEDICQRVAHGEARRQPSLRRGQARGLRFRTGERLGRRRGESARGARAGRRSAFVHGVGSRARARR